MNDPNNVVEMDKRTVNDGVPIVPKTITGNTNMTLQPAAPLPPPTKSFYLLIVLAIIWAVGGSVALYLLVEARWNTAPGTGSSPVNSASEADGLGMVGILGAIGGYVRCLHTFTRCFSREETLEAWAVSTFLTPLKSCLLALIVALVVKAGLINATSSGNATNWLGIYAISALVGLFASEALSKLEEVFKTIFGATQKTQSPNSSTTQSQSPPNQLPTGP
jgi:hypothetical protein